MTKKIKYGSSNTDLLIAERPFLAEYCDETATITVSQIDLGLLRKVPHEKTSILKGRISEASYFILSGEGLLLSKVRKTSAGISGWLDSNKGQSIGEALDELPAEKEVGYIVSVEKWSPAPGYVSPQRHQAVTLYKLPNKTAIEVHVEALQNDRLQKLNSTR